MEHSSYGGDYYSTDHGAQPLITDIGRAAKNNPYFRTALWTGEYLQMTLMSIPAGGEIGVEMHPHLDQFLFIVSGRALVMTGENRSLSDWRRRVINGYAVFVPAGTWHNIVNTGSRALKLYSIYAPPAHPYGTVHKTKQDADNAEHDRY